MTTKKHIAAVVLTALLATPAAAQKGDRYPDPDLDGPRVVRTIPITPSFEQRWIGGQPPPSDRFAPRATQQPSGPQNASTALPEAVGIVPVPGNRLRHEPIRSQEPVPKAKTLAQDMGSSQALCLKHGLRTVWQGRNWRCR